MSSLVSLGLRGARDQCKHHETTRPDVWTPGLGDLGPLLALLWGFCRLIGSFMAEGFFFFFFTVLAFWGFNSLLLAKN